MKVPVSWLRDYVDFDLPVEELARRLVFTSCEVDRIVRRGVPGGGNYQHFVVGKVLEADKHPNADKLQLTRVDVGDGEPRSIVCGAWNFGAGATVAVVLPGGVMPGGEFTIERRKLRGEISDGMILSEREVELGQDHAGIMVLPDELEAGTPLTDVLPIGDDILEIETLYNRSDLTSIYGIAREVAALLGTGLRSMPGVEPARSGGGHVDVVIDDLHACPRYIGRLFRDVRIGESPAWLKARLLGAGMRPISNVVDVTNYVMLALGSPLHAFDYDTLAGGRIVVRRARPGETLETLDGTVRELDPADLVIADAERPVAVAGVMGGAETEVTETTSNVLLEAANFEQLTVLRSGERHHMRTESQTRWEKGVHPELAAAAARYASQLIVELAGARWTGEGEARDELPDAPVIAYAPTYADESLGLAVPRGEQRERLTRLGFAVDGDDGSWRVQTPYWRWHDVLRDIDLVEEVGRFRLEDVPATLPERTEMFGVLTHRQKLRRAVEDVLVGGGLYEAYTYSLQAWDPDPDAIELPEPLSSQQRVLRTTLAVGLLGAAQHNVDMGNTSIELFEIAHVYIPPGPVPREPWRVGGIVEGDFFKAKGIVEAVFEAVHVEPEFVRAPPRDEFVVGATVQTGWVGTYGPLDLEGEWSAFELDLDELTELVPERVLYRDVITYPPLRLDLAFVVDDGVPAGELIAAARAAAGEELRNVRFLSDYRGDPIPRGRKSLAIAVAFQSHERTLTDDDAARLRDAIVAALGEQFGAELRA
jgi:phenylalanyl-tRNA synthetase beta chain